MSTMTRPLLPAISPKLRPELVIGAAATSTFLSRRLSWSDAEIFSDTFCWTALAATLSLSTLPKPAFRQDEWKRNGKEQIPNHRPDTRVRMFLEWMIAAGVVAMSLCNRQGDATCLYPLLTPLTVAFLRYSPWKTRQPKDPIASVEPPPLGVSLWRTLGGSTVASVFYILLLVNTFNGHIFVPGLAVGAGQIALSLTIILSSTTTAYPPNNPNAELASISKRIAVFLLLSFCVEVTVFGVPSRFVAEILLVGSLKAVSVYFLTLTARDLGWEVAIGLITFSVISETDPMALPSGRDATLLMVASCFALYQVFSAVPQHIKLSRCTWLLLLVPLWYYVISIWAAHSTMALGFSDRLDHDMGNLSKGADKEFQSLLQRQSSSYIEAHKEYQRRYNMDPPLGFQSWYEMAVSRDSPIIDDFDVLYRALLPFWSHSGEDVAQMIKNAYHTPGSDLWLCTLCSDGIRENICQHSFRKFDRHLSKLFDGLPIDTCQMFPDITVLVNHLDEPRVVVPPHEPMTTSDQSSAVLNAEPVSDRPSNWPWHAITSSCRTRSAKSTHEYGQKPVVASLRAVTNITSAMDLCAHPEYSSMHGLFINPTSFKLLQGMVPVLSTGVPSTMGDVPIPSPAYAEREFQYHPLQDHDWERKRNNLYWVGSTTGGYAADERWHSYHRQRFVTLAQGLKPYQGSHLTQGSDNIGVSKPHFLNRRLWDVAFTRVNQCTPSECRNQKAYFRMKPWAPSHKALHSRLVFDTDGNGISGRYYQLLASSSTPLKQTVLREWHDDRLVPWVHYIPVSQSLEELSELVTYLTSTDAGQHLARRVAHQGQDWAAKALRLEDVDVYVYRLVIELARLQNPERPARMI